MLKKQYNLSTYIAITITSLVVASTLTVSCVLYFSLIKSLTNEFEERVKAESREISLTLTNRFREVETKLRTLVYDNTVRVTLMLGAENQLSEHLTTVYSGDHAVTFYVQDEKGVSLSSSSESGSVPLEAWQALSKPAEKTIISNDMSNLGFKLTINLPITRQKDTIGSAAAVYVFKRDELLSATLEKAHSSNLITIDDGNCWNLLTGEISEVPFDYLTRQNKSQKIYRIETSSGNYAAIAISAFPNMVVMASVAKLQLAKLEVLYNVVIPAAAIIILSFIISFIISNRMVTPLRRLSKIAHGITEGETDVTFAERKSSIVEFNQMSSSLALMMQHLQHLREMERYQELFEGVADIVLIHNLDGHLIDANEIALSRLEVKYDELHLADLLDIIPEEKYSQAMKILNSLEESGDQRVFSFSFTNSSGEEIFLECHVRKIRYGGKHVILNVARDITDRKTAEAALQRSHATLTTVMDSIQATIIACDIEENKVLFMNSFLKDIAGKDLVGKSCQEAGNLLSTSCSNCGDNFRYKYSKNKNIPPWEGQSPLNDKWYLYYDSFIDWVDGRLVKFQIAFDITDIKLLAMKQEQAEKQLRKSQKMEAIGTLAGGVAHDLNNILTGIVSYPDMLLSTLPPDSPLRRPLKTIKESGLKASATVSDLLTMARRGVQVHEVVNLSDVVVDYLASPEHKVLMSEHMNVEIEIGLDDDLLSILGSPVHLTKTVMNLVKNGVESIQGKGKVTVCTAIQQLTSPPPSNPKIVPGEYVVLTIADNGSGISQQDSEKIFEPFFTTKVMGKSGTGLGMAVIWGTVEDHEGYIDLESTPGEGTTFRLFFPATRAKMLKEHLVLTEENYSGNGEMILVVDDVKEQREICLLLLSQLGYRVMTVTSGEEAVEYLTEQSVDLVILDMIMEGGMNGLETYKTIIGIHPGQKAIITSGYSRTTDVKEAMKLGVGQYVKKPFLIEDIAKAVMTELKIK